VIFAGCRDEAQSTVSDLPHPIQQPVARSQPISALQNRHRFKEQ